MFSLVIFFLQCDEVELFLVILSVHLMPCTLMSPGPLEQKMTKRKHEDSENGANGGAKINIEDLGEIIQPAA
jgi:hypothetical protein